MKFDLHTHHLRCGHASGTIEDYVQAAIEADLQIIGISDHSPFFAHEKDKASSSAMAKSEFPGYVNEVLELKRKYAGTIEVLLGVESDYFPESEHIYRTQYGLYPFDYIIGSIHFINGTHLFNKTRWAQGTTVNLLEEKALYFKSIQQSAKSGMFDILGHVGALRAFFHNWDIIGTELLDETLQVIADSGVAIEVNTSGKLKPCETWFPTEADLERVHYYGIPITFGSDAHQPHLVGYEWHEAITVLKKIGFKEIVYYQDRKRKAMAI